MKFQIHPHLCSECGISRTKMAVLCKLAANEESYLSKSMYAYAPGQVLFHEHDPVKYIYCISAGKFKLSNSSNQHTYPLARVGRPGDVLGISDSIFGEKHLQSATAVRWSYACRFPLHQFRRMLTDQAKVMDGMLDIDS